MLDPNFDGAISTEELERILAMVQEAVHEQQKLHSPETQNPFMSIMPEPDSGNTSVVRIFGVKAFIESVLKIGLSYLSFHGTPEQSELPTQTKLMWLVTYMNQHLQDHRKKGKVIS